MFTTRLRALSVFVVLAAAGSGLLLAQSPQAVGTWVGVGAADNPFGNGASVALTDGRTLIVSGAGPDGAATNVVATFDAATNLFAIAGTLLSARTGHTATLLKDGRVLVTGGITNSLVSTDIELFDPSTGSSTLVAQMAEPRRGHVAALLQSGSVLIAGGYTSGDAVLQSAFIFDPATNSVSPTPGGLNVARASASATSLIDGRVAIVGGTDGTNDLRSAEIYDPSLQSFSTVSTQLSIPVRGHSAVLLPHNGSVLVAGGTSNGVAQAGADLFLPAQFPDPFSWGVGQFAPTAAMSAARSSAIAGPTATEGYAVVTAGGSNDVERYRFATIKTDKDDYAPGEHALITGTGWQPGEQVTLTFQEDPAVHDDYELTVVADGAGNIRWDQWAPEEHDLNVRFYLLATDSRSRAQITFTDHAPHGGNHDFTFSTSGLGVATSVTITGNRINSGVNHPSVPYSISFMSPGPSGSVQSAISISSGPNALNSTLTFSGFPTSVPATGGTYNLQSVSHTSPIAVPTTMGRTSVVATYEFVASNVAPVVTLSGSDSANEGSEIHYTFSTNDPGDTFSLVSQSCGVNGLLSNAAFDNTTGAGSFDCTFPDGLATSTVTVQVKDSQDAVSNIASISVNVLNVAPTISLTGDSSVAEGSHYSLTLVSVSDPGADTVTAYTINWGDGTATESFSGSPTGLTKTHTYADGPNNYTITVGLTDEDGVFTGGTKAITVTNVAPTISLTGDSSVAEGSLYSLTLGAVFDPGLDTVDAYAINWGDGSPSQSFSGSPVGASPTHTYTDGPNNYTIMVSLKDEDGTFVGATKAITVTNVAPTISLSGASNVDEGAVYSLSLGSVVDPGADAVTAYTINWGDGSSSSFSGSPNGLTKTHTYADGPNTYTITIDLTDDDGPHVGAGTKSVTVDNVAPTLTITAPTPGQLYAAPATVYLTASIVDPGADTLTCVISWDDGSGTTSVTASGTPPNKTCSANHQFPSAGVYTIQVTVNDGDGGVDTESVMVVVYDPSAGFVTGGGWIMSPAYAYVADPTLTGKANFGFVSKYLKGATTPTGQTEFQFHAGSLNFHSDVYQWLVVSGAKAQYKGTGSLNGVPGYDFLLTATDGQLNGGGGYDKFRIKITLNGNVVYDNVPGGLEDIDAANPQIVSGGSIVIHAPKK